MLRTITNAMVFEMGELKVKENNGREVKYINFKIGTRRSTRRTVTDENGNTKKEYINDYMYCMAFGNTAQILADYCDNYDDEGNFKPRLVYLEGKVENYTYEKEISITDIITIDGKKRKITLTDTIPQYGSRMIVDQVMFMDSNPEFADKNNTGSKSAVVETVEDDDDTQGSGKATVETVSDENTKDSPAHDETAVSETDSASDTKDKKKGGKSTKDKKGGKDSKDNKKGGKSTKDKKKSGKDSKDDKKGGKDSKIKTKEIEIEEDDTPANDNISPEIDGLFN